MSFNGWTCWLGHHFNSYLCGNLVHWFPWVAPCSSCCWSHLNSHAQEKPRQWLDVVVYLSPNHFGSRGKRVTALRLAWAPISRLSSSFSVDHSILLWSWSKHYNQYMFLHFFFLKMGGGGCLMFTGSFKWSSCFKLPSAGIIGIPLYLAWIDFIFFFETEILYLVQHDLKLSSGFIPFSAEIIWPRELTWLKAVLVRVRQATLQTWRHLCSETVQSLRA